MKSTLIYNRTSTKDQNPELQLKDCMEFIESKSLKLVLDPFTEKGSAFKKDKIRPEWESCIKIAKEKKYNIVLWRYDRAFRNKKEFFKFMKTMFEVYGVKIYSVKEPSIISFWDMMDQSYSENPVFNELINNIFKAFWDFMIQQAGEEAEEESRKKSERVKLAMVKEEGGPTKSYKGNTWGRKNIATKRLKEEIFKLREENPKITLRQIAAKVFYYDKNNNQRNPSPARVMQILNSQ